MITDVIDSHDLAAKTGTEAEANLTEAEAVDQTEKVTEAEDAEAVEKEAEAPVDYEALMYSDMEELKGKFPELRGINNLTELNNPLRYAALRDLGLTPEEAYLATSRPRGAVNNRAHLFGAAPRRAGSPGTALTEGELANCRELFDGMSDDDIRSLYRKVTK